MNLNKIYTPKQIEILKETSKEDWFMLINHGAKRSGKTQLDNDIFLKELIRVRKIADEDGVTTPQYILAGYNMANIQDNILTELSNKYGFEFKFDKFNNFNLFGVKVVQTSHGQIGGLGRIRGMTSYGAYINEASLANQEVFDEIKARCSGRGARIIADTNPDHPEHWLLKDYIESDAKGIKSYHFRLDDNTFLDERYKQQIKETTPKGMFYDRGVEGLWVSGQGVIYSEFDKNVHVISADQAKDIPFERFFCGVDWGWEHTGVITLFGVSDGAYYLLDEWAYKHRYIDKWIEIAKGIVSKYGNIPFYCDSARPEHVSAFQNAGLNAFNANKRVLSGIEEVADVIHNNMFYVVLENCPQFREEIYKYAWKPNGTEPLKENDDCMDAVRYGIYSDVTVQKGGSMEEKQNKAKKLKRLL